MMCALLLSLCNFVPDWKAAYSRRNSQTRAHSALLVYVMLVARTLQTPWGDMRGDAAYISGEGVTVDVPGELCISAHRA